MRPLPRILLAVVVLYAVSSTAHAAPKVYVYKGAGCTGLAALPAFENLLGRKVDGVVDFDDYTLTPDQAVANLTWQLGCWRGHVANIAESIGLAFNGVSTAQIAAGAMDRQFTEMGESLVSHGFSHAYIRLAWEMNGGWYRWGQKGLTYVAAFNHVAPVLKKACPNCKIIWNPAAGIDPTAAFPGTHNVDVIGSDEYANTWNSGGARGVFGTTTTGDYGGNWGFSSFRYGPRNYYVGTGAEQRPYAIPEMGVGGRADGHGVCTGTGWHDCDDGAFMSAEIASAPDAQFIGFWDYEASDYRSQFSDGSRPNEGLAFLQAECSPAVQARLKGATLYTAGAIKPNAPKGYHAILARAVGGDVLQLAWGDAIGQMLTVTDLTHPPH